MARSDIELVYLAKAGRDDRAFAELVRRHQARLRAFLLKLSGDESIVDDIAQLTLLKAHRAIGDFRGGSSFRSWLFAIAYREFLQQKRRDASERRLHDAVAADAPTRGKSAAPAHDRTMELKSALATLPEQERAALLLCDAAGFTHAEAAAAMNIPLGTLKSTIPRARNRLRAVLSPDAPGETAGARAKGACHAG